MASVNARGDTSGNGDGLHRIVVVGGGAGGLELATRLGRRLGQRRRAEVALVDATLTHLWKPLLHEVSAGTLDSHEDAIEFLAQARTHHFRFRLGRMQGLDRHGRCVHLAPLIAEGGWEVAPARTLRYDTLALAVGSTVNDFGVPGARQHCVFLDGPEEAERFHRVFFQHHLRAQAQKESSPRGWLSVGIVGAGATGVELAAELHAASRYLADYGLDRIEPGDMQVVLVEAADRVLPGLPVRVSRAIEAQLRRLGVEIHTGEQVAEVTEEGMRTNTGRFVPCRMKVWAAGIKAPDFLEDLGGLETNRINQLVVRPTLQTTRDDDIFAFGDCAQCPWVGHEGSVPPRAQAAHQQATLLARSLERRLEGRAPAEFHYRDRGSLVSLSGYTTVGNLMGNLMGEVTFEGWLARLAYRSLYRMHQRAVHGTPRTLLIMLADWFRRGAGPQLKLH
ncbi:MAG: NAD(P)/FAD-dependent oxidoreductase [Gammaproteobacteria bacterium]|nr:NAD(P)/FAD-dependent oxidoreductase [Gammaproteobacteria bacterium]NIR81994.1 NAD(P)/FAD-dependent oxidoreductase [Gammaproteobacteria bacterium]NIR89051.1 NAD(P)/FAD-dependent oxidoreductase [Gammaproteobacteria bacterium]NIU03101.1 NAD(P)/FAD-dependent oxidoreductase [Gammaproteobacteria bacterium]NIV50625.1 FAD-dependent oxidoreductase [Gammaproteobacteria bacterium]